MPHRKNVFILGAGASVEAGGPTMWSFLPVARDLKDDRSSVLTLQSERERFQHVFDRRFELERAKASVNLDLDNIEDLFGLVDLDCRTNKAGAEETREHLVFLIVRTLRAVIRPTNTVERLITTAVAPDQVKAFNEQEDVYDFFARLVARTRRGGGGFGTGHRDHIDAVITFNYDTLVDDGMVRAGVAPIYSLPPSTKYNDDQPRSYKVPLLKLHGSTNWYTCPKCADRVYVDSSGRRPSCEKDGSHQTIMAPLIVPPTWDKGGNNNFLRPVWQKAREELASAHRWFIIGYSSPPSDRFFQYLLASSLEENRDLSEVVLVNPAADPAMQGELGQRYREMFTSSFVKRKFKVRTSKFFEYVSKQLQDDLGFVF